ncbi:hypothetical protein COCON_G00221160, partial [Conger conger]
VVVSELAICSAFPAFLSTRGVCGHTHTHTHNTHAHIHLHTHSPRLLRQATEKKKKTVNIFRAGIQSQLPWFLELLEKISIPF